MFKITRDLTPDRYIVSYYIYIHETNFHSFIYSVANITAEDVAQVLKGRVRNDDDTEIQWALDIVRLTNCTAIIGDDGVLRAVPVPKQRTQYDKVEQRVYVL